MRSFVVHIGAVGLCLAGCGRESWEPPGGDDWIQVVAGSHNVSCGLRADGSARCWGYDARNGMEAPDADLREISVGSQLCGLEGDGSVSCGPPWGWADEFGIPAGVTGISQVAVGDYGACTLSDEGVVTCWGDAPAAPDGRFEAVAVGEEVACGITAAGVTCWGAVEDGPALPEGDFTDLDLGGYDDGGCALGGDGAVTCWGQWTSPAGEYASISVSDAAACGVDASGALDCWDSQASVAPPQGSDFVGVAAGTVQLCALREDGTLACAPIRWPRY